MIIGIDGYALTLAEMTGVQRYLYALCKEMSGYGIEIKIFLPHPLNHQQTARLSGCSIEYFSHFDIQKAALKRLLWFGVMLPWLARRHKVDLLWGPSHLLPRNLPRSMVKIVTPHHLGADRPEREQKVQRRVCRSLRRADHIIAISRATQVELSAHYRHKPWWDDAKLSYIPCGGIETIGCKDGEAVDPPLRSPYVLFVGQNLPRKNIPRLLQAWSLLDVDIRRRTVLVIAGKDSNRRWLPLSNLVQSMSLQGTVHLCGVVDDGVLDALYRDCLFLALPSLKEGFGLPLVEAMAHGKAVLTANNSAMPEVAGAAGYLVDARDVDSIAAGLRRLIEERALRESLELHAKAQAARYSWNRAARDMITLFEQAVAARAISQHGKERSPRRR